MNARSGTIDILVIISLALFTSCATPAATELSDFNAEDKSRVLAEMKHLGALRADTSEWYASADGKATGRGTVDSPIDLTRLLSGKFGQVRPGDVVWLRGGTYVGPFTSNIKGSPQFPIVIRQYPGERAILQKDANLRDRGTLDVRGDHVWFWDIEVTNTSTDRTGRSPSGEMDPMRGSGINIYGANTKYINMTVHDNGHGFGLWNEDGGTEIYGCIVFNNGNNKKEHGVYGHNRLGSHAIRNNIIFNNAGYGLHLYANSTKSGVSGFDVEQNTVFNNGALTPVDQVADQILVGGVEGVPADRIALKSNYIFNEIDAPTSKNRGIRLGYRDTGNKAVKLIANYIVSKVPLRILWWQSVEARDNTIKSDRHAIDLVEPPIAGNRDYRFDANIFLASNSQSLDILVNDKKVTLASWQDRTGFGRNSKSIKVQTPAIFVIPNRYDSRRAAVTIYNWSKEPKVEVDLNLFLQKDGRFQIFDAQDPFGGPVVSSVFGDQRIALPMDRRSVAKPIGETEARPEHSGIEFGVFLITKNGGD